MKTTRKARKGERCRTFAQRNSRRSVVINGGGGRATVAKRRDSQRNARSLGQKERSIETTGAFIFRSPGRRRIRWWFLRECKSSRVCSLSSLSALSLNPLLSLYPLLIDRCVYSIALNGCKRKKKENRFLSVILIFFLFESK